MAVAPKLYGIPSCDTIKKARKWLESNGIVYDFHDYKKAGVDEALLRGWVEELGWENLLNKGGTTFRKLPDMDKENIDADKAIALMLANPSMIKRPVLDYEGQKIIGFKSAIYESLFS
ncbi:MAG: ArsC family reductase [Sphingobium sp.]|nr:ArsC family reductase [Sphingobium sp.]